MNGKRGLILVAAIIVFCVAVSQFEQRCSGFADLRHARQSIEDAGYHCVGDVANGQTLSGFVVSRTPIPWEVANDMRKAGPMGKEWTGRAWITREARLVPTTTTPGDSAPRVWGNVLAFGDQELLDEIEKRLNM